MLPPSRFGTLVFLVAAVVLARWPCLAFAEAPEASVHGSVSNETAYRISSPNDWTKIRNTLRLYSDVTLTPSVSFRIGGRFWYDPVYDITDQYSQEAEDDLRLEADLREAYADIKQGSWHFRVGKQQVVWGEAVGGLFVADVVTPKDLREFILPDPNDIRVPVWALDAQYYHDNMDFEWVWIPVSDFNDLPPEGSEFARPNPLPPGLPSSVHSPEEPPGNLHSGSGGLRASAFILGWDLSLLYLYTFDPNPAPYRTLMPLPGFPTIPAIVITPRYDRIHIFGATFSKEVRDVIFKGEATYRTSSPIATTDPLDPDGMVKSDVLDYLLSADATLFHKLDCNLQWLQRILIDPEPGMTEENRQTFLSLWLKTGFLNNRIEPEFFVISNLRERDFMLRPKLNYRLNDRWTAALGLDLFGGVEDGAFGVYRDKDRAYVTLTCAF